jgi:Xaa-Pro aminopeptidase
MSDVTSRVARLRGELVDRELDAIVIWQPQNRRYLSGFTGSTGILLLSADRASLITDSRYFEQVLRQCPEYELERVEGQAFNTLAEVLQKMECARVGIEADTVTVSELQRLDSLLPDVSWVSTSGLVEAQRAVKDEHELVRLEAAVDLTDRAMAHAREVVLPGMTERELAWELEVFMRESGAEGLSFDTIVAAGENGALPHHEPSDRPINLGEPIVIDMGALLDGYCGDLTRTFAVGTPEDADYEKVYEIVDRANREAIASLEVGMTGPEADGVARGVIAAEGYGEYFGHGLGHGVGLYIHELPRLGPTAGDSPLQANMVMTIEPGIYLPGRFGVRIEDVVLLQEDGAHVLSAADKQPVALA